MRSKVPLVQLWLVEPAFAIHDFNERRRVRLFAVVQFVVALALLPMALKWLPIEEGYEDAPFFWLFLMQSIAYVLYFYFHDHISPI